MSAGERRGLVSGGAGFLGSHVCERLLADGCEVLCVDDCFTGLRQNVRHLLGNPRFEALRHDVTFPLYVEVDKIYNLACPASPVHDQHDPLQRRPDIERAQSLLNWTPSVSLSVGLERTIAYFDAMLAGRDTADGKRASPDTFAQPG